MPPLRGTTFAKSVRAPSPCNAEPACTIRWRREGAAASRTPPDTLARQPADTIDAERFVNQGYHNQVNHLAP